MKKKKKKKKTNELERIRKAYHRPQNKGSLRGVARFAKAQRLPLKQVRQALERDLAYTLHKPV